ncbi:MAG: hypothetical protein V3T55_00940 [Anaerolineales bacterium]
MWKALTQKSLLARILQLGGAASAGIFASFLLTAYLIISGNRDDINSPELFTAYFLTASAVLTVLLLLLLWILPLNFAKFLAFGIVSYALVALALDAVLPLGISELETGRESASAAPLWGSLLQIAGTLGLMGLLWRLPLPLVGRLGWTLAVLVVATTAIPTFVLQDANPPQAAAAAPIDNKPSYNIYHVVFDSYYGPWLQHGVNALELDPDTFSGFTHYRGARSNYWYTRYSYPSFMSGTTYESTMTITEWRDQAERDSMIRDLREAGFRTSYWGLLKSRGVVGTADEVHMEGAEFSGLASAELSGLPRVESEFYTILDLWAVRASPVGLRHLLFQEGSGPISRHFAQKTLPEPSGGFPSSGNDREEIRISGDTRSYRSFQQFLLFLEAEQQRPPTGDYVHVHVQPPHAPYQLDREGLYIGESSYNEQLLLATNMMSMFVERLKELDHFDNSFIILQSDHGNVSGAATEFRGDPERDFITIDDPTNARITEMNLRGADGRTIDARFSALLLVKLPATCVAQGVDEPLRLDSSLTQLKDLREFVNQVVSGETADCKFPSREFLDIQLGMRQRNAQGEMMNAQELGSGELNVFRIGQGGKWEILPNTGFQFK